jgi:hypothetical protein
MAQMRVRAIRRGRLRVGEGGHRHASRRDGERASAQASSQKEFVAGTLRGSTPDDETSGERMRSVSQNYSIMQRPFWTAIKSLHTVDAIMLKLCSTYACMAAFSSISPRF